MNRLWWCLIVAACGSVTEPADLPVCPDGMELWHWSYMDTLGVLTERDLCLPGGTFDSVFGPTTLDSNGHT